MRKNSHVRAVCRIIHLYHCAAPAEQSQTIALDRRANTIPVRNRKPEMLAHF
jgi:hypothetical protein